MITEKNSIQMYAQNIINAMDCYVEYPDRLWLNIMKRRCADIEIIVEKLRKDHPNDRD